MKRALSPLQAGIVRRASVQSFVKLDPRAQLPNPVMFVVWTGSLLVTLLLVQALVGQGEAPAGFIAAVAAGCEPPCSSPTSPIRGRGPRQAQAELCARPAPR
jgi:hypothetical protein